MSGYHHQSLSVGVWFYMIVYTWYFYIKLLFLGESNLGYGREGTYLVSLCLKKIKNLMVAFCISYSRLLMLFFSLLVLML